MEQGKTYINTGRLILRDWKESDTAEFVRMNSDEQVMRYFLKTLSPEESSGFLGRIRQEIADCGFGLFAVERAEDHAFIGFVGLHKVTFDVDFAPDVEIGWRLLPEYHGRGYATEAAKACLEFARDTIGLKAVCSFTSLPNKASERVMQKTGMTFVKEFDHPMVAENHPLQRHVLYEVMF